MNILLPIVALFLAVVSIYDWKFKEVPSIILTGMLFVVLALNLSSIGFGLLAVVIALLMYEADFISGIADLKIITIIGLMATNLFWFFISIVLIFVFGIVYKLVIKKFTRTAKKQKQVAFIPVLFAVYLALWILGGIA